MNRRISYFLIPFLVALLSQCLTPRGMASSARPLIGQKIKKKLGPAEASASEWAVLGFTLGAPDLHQIADEAMATKKADNLLRIQWYEQSVNLILLQYSRYTVRGEAVRYSNEKDEEKK